MRRGRGSAPTQTRQTDYSNLRNPFPPMKAFSDDHIATMHNAALDVLETHGIKVLLPQAREIFAKAGARVGGEMVYIGRDVITATLAMAPRQITAKGAIPKRDLNVELGSLMFQPGAGCPHATDRIRGRRPGTLADFDDLVRLTQHFDVLHMTPPLVEPQDIPIHLRHYAMLETQMRCSDKIPFAYSRGTAQAMDNFELLRDFRGLTDDAFALDPHCYTIINTNSPRTLDIPMAQGLIDFARHGQLSIVTPFTLMGAMAPITVAGAVTLSHTEALAAIALTQLTRPGAPVCYGTFTSNVDMKSGAPVFGTPEHFRASLAAGQLARFIELPWRSASGSAANLSDVQAANETQFGTWGCLMAGATVVIHAAGWLEGGLSISYEKLVTDVEVLQMVAELCMAGQDAGADLGLDAIGEVQPGGHFFGTPHTMARYKTEFYDPLVADYSNFGTWREKGEQDATTRATGIWQDILATPPDITLNEDRLSALQTDIAQRSATGGAAPVS
ncbi:trimethylamine methyltransferase [Sulfitobacter sp. SK012]|uniref:trimethylamine methyltransferase family protein n=1 Tax=Sulfitobacter sp. SK012 TaxID=1389005 RepID=UPI000E0BF983|nr:trimethylamine methyltransferase family protein [Sulfitobacter sp. SK012]AXI44945.1 trimethylamine methyltransferase [Sulfitobacter sp. SK012]